MIENLRERSLWLLMHFSIARLSQRANVVLREAAASTTTDGASVKDTIPTERAPIVLVDVGRAHQHMPTAPRGRS